MTPERLTSKAHSRMVQFFKGKGHKPSGAMLEGLRRAQETLTAMLTGQAPNKYHLCSLDPGVGKSTAIIKWLQVYLESPYSETEGVLIGLDRYEDLERFISESGLPENHFAALASNSTDEGKRLNVLGLGQTGVNSAAVLFTTKEQIKLRAKGYDHRGKPFGEIEAFFYKGKPRPVRIWDEGLTVGKGLTLERFQLSDLFSRLRKKHPETVDTLERVFIGLKTYKDKTVCEMPDIGLSVNEMLSAFTGAKPEEKQIAETLALMSGRAVVLIT